MQNDKPLFPQKYHVKGGFTLIELSIVLVIIGLIISGVLMGRDMIRAAEIRNVIQDVKKIQTAMYAFRVKYNALPGDMSNAYEVLGDGTITVCGANTIPGNEFSCNGNGNGLIGDQTSTQGLSETLRFWLHLQLSGLIKSELTGYNFPAVAGHYRSVVTRPGIAGTGGGTGPTIPLSNMRTGMGYAIISPIQPQGSWPNGLFYGHTGARIMTSYPPNGISSDVADIFGNSGVASLTPATAANIDMKIDDGLPTSGVVVGSRHWTGAGGTGNCTNPNVSPSTMDTQAADSSIVYDLTNTNTVCNSMFHLGGG